MKLVIYIMTDLIRNFSKYNILIFLDDYKTGIFNTSKLVLSIYLNPKNLYNKTKDIKNYI